MAKRRLTDDAIRYIINCRNDASKAYTWQEISDLVKAEYNVHVSLQATSQAYKKHKDSFNKNQKVASEDDNKSDSKINKPVTFERKFEKSKSKSFDDSIPDNDLIQDLMQPKGEI